MRRFRRRHDRRSKAHRTCEAIAAFIPALVFLFHLATRAAEITPPEKRERHPITLTDSTGADGKVTVATPVTTVAAAPVPEPNVLTFVGLSFAALAYSRRKLNAVSLQPIPLAPTAQPSKIAIAAA